MCEYKAEMKCTWTAESSRMKCCVQLGLLCLSLLISSLHGEAETDSSKEIRIYFEEPDLHQPEMHRVRRQLVSAEKEDITKTEVIAPPTVYRTKRQNKSKNKKRNPPRPGSGSLLGSGLPQHLQKTARAKRDERAREKRPWPGN